MWAFTEIRRYFTVAFVTLTWQRKTTKHPASKNYVALSEISSCQKSRKSVFGVWPCRRPVSLSSHSFLMRDRSWFPSLTTLALRTWHTQSSSQREQSASTTQGHISHGDLFQWWGRSLAAWLESFWLTAECNQNNRLF